MHPLVRMQRDAMLHARKAQAHSGDDNVPALTSEFFPTSAWSPEPSPHTLASGSASPYSPAAPLVTLPPDTLHFTPHTSYNAPAAAHVPSNASYDTYVRQRHDSPQPLLLEPVCQDFRSGPMMNDRSYFGSGTSADCIVPSNAFTEWPSCMYASQPPQQQQWQSTTTTKPMSRMSSSSTTGFSHPSSAASSFSFEPLSLHDLIISSPPFESNEDAFMQLIPDSSYLAPELIPHGHHHEELTNFSFQNYIDYRPQ